MKQTAPDWNRLHILRIIALSSVNETHNKMEMHNQSNFIQYGFETLETKCYDSN